MTHYKLGIRELDNAIGGIRKGSNIMMIGPSMSGKEIILRHIAYFGAAKDENAIIILTTREPALNILEWFQKSKMVLPLEKLGIIDCVTKNMNDSPEENKNIKLCSSPVDLTGIGVKISHFFEELMNNNNKQKIQLHLDSLSTLMMYSNIQTVFRFLHVFTGRIRSAGALGIFLIDSRMHDEHAIGALKQLFNGIIEIKSENDKNFIRIVGISPKPTPWLGYEIEGQELLVKVLNI